MNNSFCYFKNTDCVFYPCHEIKEGDDFFNCLFCYCPLYTLGRDCGGNFKYLDGDIKDCSNCMLPHSPAGFATVSARYPEVAERLREYERMKAELAERKAEESK